LCAGRVRRIEDQAVRIFVEICAHDAKVFGHVVGE
jgi:hypothetical protein